MITRAQIWSLVGVLTLGVGATLGWQALETSRLRAEVNRARTAAESAPRTHTVQATPDAQAKLARLREDRAALERLRAEIETLKKATAAADLKKEELKPATTKSKRLTASEWKHAGRATPESAMETFLWASVNRNTELLTSSLVIEPGAAQEKAKQLLASLPEAARAYHGTPERLLAHLTAQQLAFDALVLQQTLPVGKDIVQRVREHQPEVSEVGVLVVELQKDRGASKRKTLLMQRSFDGWKFLVPESAIDRFAEQLASGEAGNP